MQRLERMNLWLESLFPGQVFTVSPASADASFRRYFRLAFADGQPSRIVMDAPPRHEDCAPFIEIAGRLAAAGVHAPQVHARNLEEGFLLLSDLGDRTYLSALQGASPPQAAALYADAMGSLIAMQAGCRTDGLPRYDEALLRRELELFPQWYLARHKGIELTPARRKVLDDAFQTIVAVNLAEPQVFVHRDFHSRNLMVCTPSPGVLDFQDAVCGPLSYDLVSLFKDAYIDWEEAFCLDLLARYWEAARKLGLPVREDFASFHRDYEWMGVQRHLKVLGIFARLHHRDGKAAYLADMPRVMHYLRKACERYGLLKPLLKLLDEAEPQAVEYGYTF